VRDVVEVPVIVENVSSYAEFHLSEMTEWEFLSEVDHCCTCTTFAPSASIRTSSVSPVGSHGSVLCATPLAARRSKWPRQRLPYLI
jgi:hypothetical protein